MSGSELPPARIMLSAALPGVEFTVVDGGFQQVAHGIGRLTADLESGIYEIATRAGGRVETELVALEPGETWSRQNISMEVFSAAPLTRSRTALTGQAEEVAAWSQRVAGAEGPDAALLLVVRRVDQDVREPLRHGQLSLLDQHLEPLACAWHEQAEIGMATVATRLEPGAYVLRFAPPAGPPLDQTLWLAAGWQTLVFCPNGTGSVDTDNASVHLTRLHEPFLPEAYESGAAMEIAMSGLRQGMPLVSDDLLRLLQAEHPNPMLGIVGTHALLLAPRPDLELCLRVTRLLREMLPDHPDVVALARRLGQVAPPVWWPPMLAASYDALLAADRIDPDTVQDDSVAERVAGYVVRRGPWLSWEASATILVPSYPTTPPDSGQPEPGPASPGAGPASPGPSSESPGAGRAGSVATAGATRRVQRHVLEVAGLTGASAHQVAGSLGVDELARRLELPVQTVRLVLQELGWSTLFVPTPDVPSRGEEVVAPVPEGRSPFEPGWDPAPVTIPDRDIAPGPEWFAAQPAATARPVAGSGRRRWWWLIAPLAFLLAVIGGAVVLANRDDDPIDPIPGPRTDLQLTIHGDTQARIDHPITLSVQVLNAGASPAQPTLTIKVPPPFELTGPVRGCTGGQPLTCTFDIAPGERVRVNLPLIAHRTGRAKLLAGAASNIEETSPRNNSQSLQLNANYRRVPTTKPTPALTPTPTPTPTDTPTDTPTNPPTTPPG